MSGGEKKRVNIGIELVADRDVLCLDEPDAGLDSQSVQQLTRLLKSLAHDSHKLIVTIIHNLSEIDEYDQLVFLAPGGKLAFCGSPEAAKQYFHVQSIKEIYGKL